MLLSHRMYTTFPTECCLIYIEVEALLKGVICCSWIHDEIDKNAATAFVFKTCACTEPDFIATSHIILITIDRIGEKT